MAFAIGGLFLLGVVQDVVVHHETPSAFGLVVALVFIAVRVINWSSYIRVDDTSVVLGSVLAHRRCDRHELARITVRVSAFPSDRFTRFVRSDGSVALTTSAFLWGRSQLESLADYLGVPLVW